MGMGTGVGAGTSEGGVGGTSVGAAGGQSLQMTVLVGMMGLVTVQGQSVMVRVVGYRSKLAKGFSGVHLSGERSILGSHSSPGRKSYLSHGVGVGAVGDGGGRRAVGDVGLNDLSDNGNVVGHGASGDGENSGSSELHFVGIRVFGRLDFEIKLCFSW